MQAKFVITLNREEIEKMLPYRAVCTAREGATWNSKKCRELWNASFTDEEKTKATAIFVQAHNWYLKKGVPDAVAIPSEILALWMKLGEFCEKVWDG